MGCKQIPPRAAHQYPQRNDCRVPARTGTSVNRTQPDLQDFVDTAAVGLHWVGPDGTILWANPADYQPLGYSEEEYVGHNISEFHAEPDVIADILQRLTQGECLQNYEALMRCKDGSTRRVLITSSVRRGEQGEFLHTRCFTVDISTRRAEGLELQLEALTREVERLRVLASQQRGIAEAILKHSPYGIIVANADGKLILQNEAAERIWAGSASAHDVEGWGQYRAFHPDGRPFEAGDWSMARALSHGHVTESEEVQVQRFDGSRGTLLGSAAPIFSAQGRLDGALSMFTDISALKAQEAELRLAGERYFTTLNSIGDAVIATDGSGNITFLNPVAEALTGWSLVEAQGRPLADVFRIVNEDTRAPVESPVDRVIQSGQIVGLANHTVLIAKNGTNVPIDDSGAPIFDQGGTLVGVVLVFRDITQRRREEATRRFLSEASALLASSLDYGPTLASVAKLAVPTIADWCAVDILEPGSVLERLAVEHVDPAKVRWAREVAKRYPADPRSPHGVHSVIRTGKSILMPVIPEELLIQSAVDAEHLRLMRELSLRSAMIVPLRCRGKTLGALSFVSTDSARQFDSRDLALAEELANVAALAVDNARLYRDAQRANRAKDEFLATVSHELRTPLNAMLGWANLLRTSVVPEEKRMQGLATIERNARAQSQLIEDLLDVSRIISGNMRLELSDVNLATIVAAATDSLRLAAEAKGVRLQIQLDDGVQHCTGDATRLQQVVWNLLSNAVKFTGPGGTVVTHLERSESGVEIRVTDTGAGVDPDALPHIFERFKQANSSATRSHGGLGLGLAIVKHLVELHGGTVSAASAGPGHGSSFLVRLPVSTTQHKPHEAQNPRGELRSAPDSLDGLRVLVVDDESDARTLLTAILEGHGARVRSAMSAAEALAKIEEEPPDVLVSDIGMPEEDGYSLIRAVRTRLLKSPQDLPALAFTAYARKEDRTRALLAGFQAHLTKPVEPNELLVVIATLAGRTGNAS